MLAASSTKLQTQKAIQDAHRAWIRQLCEATNLTPTEIAHRAKVAQSTLTRLLNKKDYDGVLSPLTIARIAQAFGVAGPEEGNAAASLARPLLGFGEGEQLRPGKGGNFDPITDALVAGRNAVDPWKLKTRALEGAGYMPGDIVAIDLNAEARPGDAVCAQVYDWSGGKAQTVFRLYDPPFLVPAGRDPGQFRTMIVDTDRVIIKGVIVGMARPGRASGAA